MEAACEGHIEIAQLLLQEGANTDMQDHEGQTALVVAAYRGHRQIAQLLLQAYANTDLPPSHTALQLS